MPGVIFNEFTASQANTLSSDFAVGVVGGGSWGPTDLPTLLTTDADIVARFGTPTTDDMGLLSAISIARRGGSVYYSRVAGSGALKSDADVVGRTITTPAVKAFATFVADGGNTAASDADLVTIIDAEANTLTFEFDTDNSTTGANTPVAPGATADASLTNLATAINNARNGALLNMVAIYDTGTQTLTVTQTGAGAVGNTAIVETVTPLWTIDTDFAGGVTEVSTPVATALALEALYLGTGGDLVQFEITEPSVLGTANAFDLRVYYPPAPGARPELVETYNGVTLAAGANNVVDVLANGRAGVDTASNYVRGVAGLSATVLNTVSASTLSGGNDGLTITDADYIGTSIGATPTGIQAFANSNAFPIYLLLVPAVSNADVVDAQIAFCEARTDVATFIDAPLGLSATQKRDWANGLGAIHSIANAPTALLDSSYGAVFSEWELEYDAFNQTEVYMPPSAKAASAFAASFVANGLGAVVAGSLRGVTGASAGLETLLSTAQSDDLLHNANINPIEAVGDEAVIMGNRTLQRFDDPYQSLHVRFGLLGIKRILRQAGLEVRMEPNVESTWTRLELRVEPELDDYVTRNVVERYDFVVDTSTNTEEQRALKQMRGRLTIKFTDIAETVAFDIAVTDTNLTFTAV